MNALAIMDGSCFWTTRFCRPQSSTRHAQCSFVGILAQSGEFFVHMTLGKPSQASVGTTITIAGAALVCAIAVLVYGLITTP